MADGVEVKQQVESESSAAEVKSEVKGEIPNDAELERVTLEILGAADLELITKKTVRRSLETKLGLFCSRSCRLSVGLCQRTSSSYRARIRRTLVREYK